MLSFITLVIHENTIWRWEVKLEARFTIILVTELELAKNKIFTLMQQSRFANVISQLRRGSRIGRNDSLIKLDPSPFFTWMVSYALVVDYDGHIWNLTWSIPSSYQRIQNWQSHCYVSTTRELSIPDEGWRLMRFGAMVCGSLTSIRLFNKWFTTVSSIEVYDEPSSNIRWVTYQLTEQKPRHLSNTQVLTCLDRFTSRFIAPSSSDTVCCLRV